jgi:hypothetical protein
MKKMKVFQAVLVAVLLHQALGFEGRLRRYNANITKEEEYAEMTSESESQRRMQDDFMHVPHHPAESRIVGGTNANMGEFP